MTLVKVRYIIEEDVAPLPEKGERHVEDWQPFKFPEDRVHVKSDDGIRIFWGAKKAYTVLNQTLKRLGRGRRLRVKRIEL